MAWLHETHSCGVCGSVYIQQEVYVEMFHAAVEGIEVFHPIPGSCESAWMWCTKFFYTVLPNPNLTASYVCWSVHYTKPSDLRVGTTKACRLWGKWKGSLQTRSVWVKPSESEESASEATGKGELQWAELSWDELIWNEINRAELSWAELRWADMRWDEQTL